jgi:hypothetical protein
MRLHTNPAHTLDRPPLKLSKLLLLLLPCVTSCAMFEFESPDGATLLLQSLLEPGRSKLLCLLLLLPAARAASAAAAAAAAPSAPTLLITTRFPPEY